MSKRPIIIDTDPGIDDALALAIALFSDELDVRLITTVAGNVSLENVTLNTLRLLTFFGKDVPVAKGAAKPLIVDFVDASNVHGKTGMEGYEFPEPKTELLLKENAVNAMYRAIMESPEPVTLVPIAALTNIALLFAVYPEVKEHIREIVMMGHQRQQRGYVRVQYCHRPGGCSDGIPVRSAHRHGRTGRGSEGSGAAGGQRGDQDHGQGGRYGLPSL